ncbi:MAG TPA: MMPL family transporter [Nevskiaceae bacterium]|nr:MMPL family transporter [Nevskiaceae bacterium]
MTETASSWLARALERWVRAVQRRAAAVVTGFVVLIAALSHYAATHLSVDTDTANMLSPQLPWRVAERELGKQFPSSPLLIVVDGETPEIADDAEARLIAALRTHPDLYANIFAAEADPFFRHNGLLYLSMPELQKLGDGLTKAQPFLGALSQDPTLHGLSSLLIRALDAPAGIEFDLTPALNKIAEAVGATADGKFYRLSWQTLMSADASPQKSTRRYITMSPTFDYSKLLPGAVPIDTARAIAKELQLDAAHGVRVRLTGSAALEHEELQSAFGGAVIALGGALVLVAILLFAALHSYRLVIAAVLTLAAGLMGTAAFAAATVGHLNLISVAFGVLYVGLGIDYALYLCMQYRELIGQGMPHDDALPRAAQDVGGFMMVCAATTSLGFFAFIPTDFLGIAELGLISGAGMFISLVVSLTLLPALIQLMPPDPLTVRLSSLNFLGRVLDWPYVHARKIWIGAAIAAAFAIVFAPRARFDYDPLNIRNPQAESVSTFRELMHDPDIPALSVSALAPDLASADALKQKLRDLPLVRRALDLSSFIPDDQDEKIAYISDLSLSLSLSPPEKVAAPPAADEIAALEKLRAALPASSALAHELARFLEVAKGQPQRVDALRAALLGALPAQISTLSDALNPEPVTEASLPPQIARRWKSADGVYRVEIWPKEVLDNPQAMDRFIGEVRTVAPAAAGPPVGMTEAGQAVVHAFRSAFISSFVAITILLLILLRSVTDTLFVLIPLTLAGLLTVAIMVVAGVPFNFANVIALPLILGVGVDYSVYLVQRGHAAASAHVNLLQTSTARAVLYGALITMANFINLMLTPHPGMVSMGALLTAGLGMTLVCALILLPSLIARRYR